jgi:Ca2+-binding RTX toxin-like protein
LAFTTTTGANGVVSLVGTSGVDADLAIVYNNNVFIDGLQADDQIGLATQTGQGFVSGYTVIGGEGGDTIRANGTSVIGSTVWGDSITTDADGNEVVTAGDDLITFATVQNTTILGLGGIDRITTGITQSSDINGNEDFDRLTIGFAGGTVSDSFIRGGKGIDTIIVNGGLLLSNHINGNKDGDTITVTLDADGIVTSTVYGGQGNDRITVRTGVDSANASKDGFIVFGDLGNDTIQGSARNDTIEGGEGNDSITGGNGADLLTGGTGSNIFRQVTGSSVAATKTNGLDADGNVVWTYADGVDVITDATFSATAGADSDTITFDAVAVTSANTTPGVWNSTAKTFTFNPAGADFIFEGVVAGDASSFIIVGSLA